MKISLLRSFLPDKLDSKIKIKFNHSDELWILSTGLNSKKIENYCNLKNTTATIRLIPNMVMSHEEPKS